jgi:hypothetical protein
MRTKEEWENRYQCVKRLMSVMDTLSEDFEGNNRILETCATMLRNPIIFDNNVKVVKTRLPYSIENMNQETEDHLIGISNIVLYMYKRKLHKKWYSVEDFKKTLKLKRPRSGKILYKLVLKRLYSLFMYKDFKEDFDDIRNTINKTLELIQFDKVAKDAKAFQKTLRQN